MYATISGGGITAIVAHLSPLESECSSLLRLLLSSLGRVLSVLFSFVLFLLLVDLECLVLVLDDLLRWADDAPLLRALLDVDRDVLLRFDEASDADDVKGGGGSMSNIFAFSETSWRKSWPNAQYCADVMDPSFPSSSTSDVEPTDNTYLQSPFIIY